MKVLITSDWHLGVRNNSSLYHQIFTEWRDKFLIPQIQENNIDELAILADLYEDRSEINVKTDNLGTDSFDIILDNCKNIQIKLLVGNHDIYFKNTLEVNSLKKFKKYERLEVIDSIVRRKVENRIIIYCPWLIKKDELKDFVEQYGKADILFGHFDINGFQMVRGVPEKSGWNRTFFAENFLRTFSGHFHLRDEQDGITYVGNPFQMQWGDYGNEKGIYILDTNTLQTKFIPNTISPLYRKIYLSQLKEKKIDYNSLRGQFIQLVLDSGFTDKILEKVIEVIRSKQPLSFTVEGDDRKTNLNVEEIQEAVTNPIEYLIAYEKELKLPEEIDRDELIKRTYEVYNDCQA